MSRFKALILKSAPPRWIDFWWEQLKEVFSLSTSYLIQYLLTVDLRPKNYFTIDSCIKTWDLLYYWLTRALTAGDPNLKARAL